MNLSQSDARNLPFESGSFQMVITSPPYFNAREEYASWNTYQDYLEDMAQVWRECYRVLCDGGRIGVNVVEGYGRPGNELDGYVPIGHYFTEQVTQAGFKLRGMIIWNKTHHVMGTAWGSWCSATNPSLRDQHELIIVAHKENARRETGRSTIDADTFLKSTSSIWVIPPASDSWHPAPFPPEIPRRLIELYTFLGDRVLDPFSGSGTTVKVANDLGRVGFGIDLSMEYLRRSDADRISLEYWTSGKALPVATNLDDLPMFAQEG